MKYKVKYSHYSKKQIKRIHSYISNELENPVSADKIVKAIMKRGDSLCLFPKASPSIIASNGKEVRITLVRKYVITYTVDDKKKLVLIRDVFHHRKKH